MKKGSDGGKRTDASRQLLGLAKELGNISEACRRLGLDRSAYYRLLKAEVEHRSGKSPGAQAANRRNPLDADSADRLLKLCVEFPDWGCDRLAHYLTLIGHPVSSPTVQKFLIKHGLGRMRERMAASKLHGSGSGGNQVSPQVSP